MHIHRYEKYWLYFGKGSLILFLSIIGFSAFTMGHHPPSNMLLQVPHHLELGNR
jgi:cytochrome c oxidase subunit 2